MTVCALWSTSVLLYAGERCLSSRTAERCSRCTRARLASCCADRTCKRIESISERARSERESARRTALPAAHLKPSHCERAGTGSARSTLWRRKQSRRQGERSAHLGERKGRATRPRAGERRILQLAVDRVPPMLKLAPSDVAGTLTCAPGLVHRCVEVAQGGLCVEAVEVATAALVAALHAEGELAKGQLGARSRTRTGSGSMRRTLRGGGRRGGERRSSVSRSIKGRRRALETDKKDKVAARPEERVQ